MPKKSPVKRPRIAAIPSSVVPVVLRESVPKSIKPAPIASSTASESDDVEANAAQLVSLPNRQRRSHQVDQNK